MIKKLGLISVAVVLLLSGCFSMMNLPGKQAAGAEPAGGKAAKPVPEIVRLPVGNLLEDPGFEDGQAGWGPFGDAVVAQSQAQAHSGNSSLFTSGRLQTWQGPALNLTKLCPKGHTYAFSLWVKLDNAETATVNLSVKLSGNTGTEYQPLTSMEAESGSWQQMKAEYTLDSPGDIIEFTLYLEGPDPGVSYYIDDVEVKSLTAEAGGASALAGMLETRELPSVPLKEPGARHDLLIGTAFRAGYLNDSRLKDIVRQQFSSITAENEMKFYVIRSSKNSYNFAPADKLLDFAQANEMPMRGHTLVWHSSMPGWLENGNWTKDSLLGLLKEYITTVVSRYKGKLYCWDVVNEVFLSNGKLRQGDDSVWFRYCGPEYIEKAFVWAHAADPEVKLFINDFGISQVNDKSTGLYNYVKDLLEKGIPVHGVGMQMHFTEDGSPDFTSIYRNMQRFAALGLEIHITELDVRVKQPASPARLMNQASIYDYVTKLAVSMDAVTSLTTWGFCDTLSWIPETYPGYGDALLLNGDFQPKPAYFAMHEALTEGPRDLAQLFEQENARLLTPFKAVYTKTPPRLDGKISGTEWDSAVVYPFAFNQLSSQDQTLPSEQDFSGNWRVSYNGNKIYGLVERRDDKTVLDQGDSWENDNLEVFFDIDGDFAQLRALVGQDFEQHEYTGQRRIVWGPEGKIGEFMIELPPENLAGKILGWNIALSDNDGSFERDHQAYPVYGMNRGWEGLNYGELEFVDRELEASRLGEAHKVLPFKVAAALATPRVDGIISGEEWAGAEVYQFAFNQLNDQDQTPPSRSDLYGTWRLLYAGDRLYGLVTRWDDKTVNGATVPRENDLVEIGFEANGQYTFLQTVVGRGFESAPDAKAVWSRDGKILEFSLPLPRKDIQAFVAGWSISLGDVDEGTSPVWRLYSVTGGDQAPQGLELGEIRFN